MHFRDAGQVVVVLVLLKPTSHRTALVAMCRSIALYPDHHPHLIFSASARSTLVRLRPPPSEHPNLCQLPPGQTYVGSQQSLIRARGSATTTMSKAVAVLLGEHVRGVVMFTRGEKGETRVQAEITGLSKGQHGFHIHQFGDTTNGCASCGPHFNPAGMTHGAPSDKVRHAGDLGNITADASGVAKVDVIDPHIPLHGPQTIVGRAIVVHEKADDLGKGGNDESLKTGNAGSRLACGIIALAAE